MDPAGRLPEVVATRGCLPEEGSFMKQLTSISESKQITKSQLKNFETAWMALTKNSQISRICLDAVGNILQRLGPSAPEGVKVSWNAINTADQTGRSTLARSPTSQTKPRTVSPPRTSPSAQSTPPMTEAAFTEQLNALARSTQITKSQLTAFATSWNALISTGQPISDDCFTAVGKILNRLGKSAPEEVKDSWGKMAAKRSASPSQPPSEKSLTKEESERLVNSIVDLPEADQKSAFDKLRPEERSKFLAAYATIVDIFHGYNESMLLESPTDVISKFERYHKFQALLSDEDIASTQKLSKALNTLNSAITQLHFVMTLQTQGPIRALNLQASQPIPFNDSCAIKCFRQIFTLSESDQKALIAKLTPEGKVNLLKLYQIALECSGVQSPEYRRGLYNFRSLLTHADIQSNKALERSLNDLYRMVYLSGSPCKIHEVMMSLQASHPINDPESLMTKILTLYEPEQRNLLTKLKPEEKKKFLEAYLSALQKNTSTSSEYYNKLYNFHLLLDPNDIQGVPPLSQLLQSKHPPR